MSISTIQLRLQGRMSAPFGAMIDSEGVFDDGYDSNHIERVLKCCCFITASVSETDDFLVYFSVC